MSNNNNNNMPSSAPPLSKEALIRKEIEEQQKLIPEPNLTSDRDSHDDSEQEISTPSSKR
ncbi:hypothetical protein [Candidatus Synchoanobacter obligatus]|uniref:Uncharacterized protein n=1 Tax=Candidatus Synchoanobacter obligatus TaxID=2919597 RepID=A0ABT1L5E3_9GAMM|nr:hypothetical protein [Candidatus Synchoanobacter obligatus]MCP8352083.1 hypothetical protein [Candidatus Synchoanobacter obligatus]